MNIFYLILLIWGPSPETPKGILIQASGQKIIVFTQVAAMLIESYGLNSQIKVNEKYRRDFIE